MCTFTIIQGVLLLCGSETDDHSPGVIEVKLRAFPYYCKY